jgi:beta-lactamase regulating signal transducer with metallopeptidase domain
VTALIDSIAGPATLVVATIVKATFVLALGLVATACARRARASVRHALLTATLTVVLALPIGSALLPALAIPIAVAPTSTTSAVASERAQLPTLAAPIAVNGQEAVRRQLPVRTILIAGWALGAALLLVWLALAVRRLHRLRQMGLPWLDAAPLLQELAIRTGVARPVELLVHEAIDAPLTYGIRRPVVLLSPEARDWGAASLRRALVHELEHIRRRDWWVHLGARVACAVYWFHPLVWIAYRQLALEAERACDDAVVEREESTQYARQLVELARQMSHANQQPSLAMANRSDLSARVKALLDSQQTRGRAGGARVTLVTVCAVAVLLSLAPVRIVAVGRRSGGPSEEQRRERVSRIDRALVEAAVEGDTEDVLSLLASGANLNAAVDGDGSPLIAAARGGHSSLVTMLLDRGADPNLAVRGDGNALIMAAREGYVEIVALLLDRGANIDDVVDGDENALIQASGHGALEVVKLLVARGADVNARVRVLDLYGRYEWRTPLSMAEQGGHRAMVEYLRSVGAR